MTVTKCVSHNADSSHPHHLCLYASLFGVGSRLSDPK
jgi:hypothetical protein